ncbi:hypothetical protein, partial [Lactococcus cremoris]
QSLNIEEDQNGERKFPDIKLYWDDNSRIIGKVVAVFTPIEINNIFKKNWDSLESLLIILYYIFCLLFFCEKKKASDCKG